jgi:hypothetical protein
MSALGQKRTFCDTAAMSALPPKADMVEHDRDVRFVPKVDIRPTHYSIISSVQGDQ